MLQLSYSGICVKKDVDQLRFLPTFDINKDHNQANSESD